MTHPTPASDMRAENEPPRSGLVAAWVVFRSRILMGISGLALVLLAAVIFYDVFCRYVIGAPSRWGFEVTTYLMAVTVMFGAAYTLSTGGHIRVDVVYMNLQGKRREIADAAAWLSAALFCAFLTWAMARIAWRSFNSGAASMDLGFPRYIPQAVVAVGALAVTVEAVILLMATLRRLKGDRT